MRIKTSDKKGFFKTLKKLAIWQRTAVFISVIIVVGGVSATVYGLATDNFKHPIVPVINSSDLSSQEPSLVIISSNNSSSESVSSQESSSEIISSQKPSSESVSSSASSFQESSPKISSKESSKESSNETSETSSIATTSSKDVSSSPPVTPAGLPEGYQERFGPYYEKNKDIAGWIKLAGTKLDYPVVQGKDNYYYLNHNEYKKSYGWGIPYMDCSVTSTKDYQSTNTVLYGHSDDKKGLQFSAIKGYRKIDFYKQNPIIEFDTVYADGAYKIVAFFIENTKAGRDFYPYHTFIETTGADAFNKFIANAKSKSYINTTVDVVPTDKLLTISTCQDTNPANWNRLVMVARKVRPGEDSSVDTSGSTQNTAQLLPK